MPIQRAQVVTGRWGATVMHRLFGEDELTVRVRSGAPDIVEVEEQILFLPGQKRSFVRFRGLQPGVAILTIQGAADPSLIEVGVVPPRVGIDVALRSPIPGTAVAQGDILLVEAWGPSALREMSITLDGRSIRTVKQQTRFTFPFPAGISPGLHQLSVVASDICGFEATHTVPIQVLGKKGPRLILQAVQGARETRSEGVGDFQPAPVHRGAGAAGGAWCKLSVKKHQVTWRVTIPRSGAWQIRVRGKSDSYLDHALVGVFTGNEDMRPVRYGPVCTSAFAVHPVGEPLYLDASEHELRFRLVNDVFDGADADRNLYLASMELRWVGSEVVDLVAPALSVVSPLDGQRFGGNLPLLARARDRGKIDQLSVYLGDRRLAHTDGDELKARIAADTLGPGTHCLRFVARDRAGNQAVVQRTVTCLPYLASSRPTSATADQEPPQLALLRVPRLVLGPDLILVEASDNEAPPSLRLVVDGKSLPAVRRRSPQGLWLRGDLLSEGEHTVKVVAFDGAGNQTTSQERTVVVLRPTAETPLSEMERAAQLIERLALGGGRRELGRLLRMGEDSWLSEQLGPEDLPQAGLTEVETSLLLSAQMLGPYQVRQMFLQRMFTSRRPVRERLGAFFDNHFSTWIEKTGARAELIEWLDYRRFATSTFRDLLGVSAHSAAMLDYLDNRQNQRVRPNENYGRELLELHTIGVDGGQTQEDVIALSRILTGWRSQVTARNSRFSFSSRHHDFRSKVALGYMFRARGGQEEGEALLDILSAHPSTARFVCQKLAEHLVGDSPPEELVKSMASVFLETGGDIPEVVRALLASQHFFRRGLAGTKIKDPLEFVVGTRRCGIAVRTGMGLQWLRILGRLPFGSASPDGYPGSDAAWLDSRQMISRWNFASVASRAGGEHLLVRPQSGSADHVRAALEECALNMILRLPPAGEVDAAVRILADGRKRVDPRVIMEAVMKMPAYQSH